MEWWDSLKGQQEGNKHSCSGDKIISYMTVAPGLPLPSSSPQEWHPIALGTAPTNGEQAPLPRSLHSTGGGEQRHTAQQVGGTGRN